jgi:hypothetical protein
VDHDDLIVPGEFGDFPRQALARFCRVQQSATQFNEDSHRSPAVSA